MSTLRRFIVDTDTGSDDVWAIVEALRATAVARVEAVTVVCGNFPLDLCVKNAMLAVEAAGTYLPPVYRGMERPLMAKTAFYAVNVHGYDGLSGMNLPYPSRPIEQKHAVDAMVEFVMSNPGEIELVTCGPLTNVAMAILREPGFASNVKRAWILGGSAGGEGNMTPVAEYNVYTDPEAAAIVLDSGMDMLWVTWDNALGMTEITPEETRLLLTSGAEAGRFCVRCTASLREYYQKLYGQNTFGVVDSLVMTAALYPDIMEDVYRANCAVELHGSETRGLFRIDRHGRLKREPNASVCARVNAESYKRRLFMLLGVDEKDLECTMNNHG